MPKMLFMGSVLPLLPRVTVSEIPAVTLERSGGLLVTMSISIEDSKVLVDCETNHPIDHKNQSYLYQIALDFTKTLINIRAFATGIGLTIHLHSLKNSEGEVGPILVEDTRLAEFCNAYTIDSNKPENRALLQEMTRSILGEPHLFIALNDLIEAITFPHWAIINCARSMETLRNIIAPGKRRKGWPAMHAALNTTEAYLSLITEASKSGRHGDHSYVEQEVSMEIVKRAWIVMNRFLEYRKRGIQSLPLAEFPLLPDSK